MLCSEEAGPFPRAETTGWGEMSGVGSVRGRDMGLTRWGSGCGSDEWDSREMPVGGRGHLVQSAIGETEYDAGQEKSTYTQLHGRIELRHGIQGYPTGSVAPLDKHGFELQYLAQLSSPNISARLVEQLQIQKVIAKV